MKEKRDKKGNVILELESIGEDNEIFNSGLISLMNEFKVKVGKTLTIVYTGGTESTIKRLGKHLHN